MARKQSTSSFGLRRAAAVALGVLAVLFAGQLHDPGDSFAKAKCRAASKPAHKLGEGKAVNATVCAINQVRRKRKLQRVKIDKRLERSASQQSRLMVNLECFAHLCPGQLPLLQRLLGVGFPPCICSWRASENLAYGKNRNSSPRKVVRAWMKSPSHKAALLEPAYRLVGIGIEPGTPKNQDAEKAATYTAHLGWFD